MSSDKLVDPVFESLGAILNGKKPKSQIETEKTRAMFLEAFIKFAEIYANNELGNMEVDIQKVGEYVYSTNFAYQNNFKIESVYDCFKLIEDDILNGMPIWRFMKCSEKQLSILENNFNNVIQEAEQKLIDTYICKSCNYLKEEHLDLGYICKCTYQEKFTRKRSGFHDYSTVKSCEDYEKIS